MIMKEYDGAVVEEGEKSSAHLGCGLSVARGVHSNAASRSIAGAAHHWPLARRASGTPDSLQLAS
jgi:hypothetical protein